MEFLRAVYQCRELSSAVLHLVSLDTLPRLEDALQLCRGPITRLQLTSTNAVSDHLAQVVSLVLKDVERPDFCYTTDETVWGREALQAIQLALFGSSSSCNVQPTFMKAILFGNMFQAQCALDFCVATLMDSLAASNCLSVFNIAASCNSCVLRDTSLTFGLQHFREAAQLDYAGLTQLSPSDLTAILSSDNLQVTSELDVFNALVTWVSYDPAARMPGFVHHLAATVRLPCLSPSDLIFLDTHPLVEKDKMALQLVAYTYLSKATGVVCDLPFGLVTNSRPRKCYPRPACPPCTTSLGSGSARNGTSHRPFADLCTLPFDALASSGAAQGHRTSSLAELVQELSAAQPAGPAPGTPLPVRPAASPSRSAPSPTILEEAQEVAHPSTSTSLPLLLLDAPTPAVRAASQSPPPVPHQAGRAKDMVGLGAALATRRSLFSASPSGGAPSVASGSGTQGSPCGGLQHKRGTSRPGVGAQPTGSGPQMRSSRGGGASQPAKMSSCFALEMALSPTKAGIQQWLGTAEAEAASDVWVSKKRIRFD